MEPESPKVPKLKKIKHYKPSIEMIRYVQYKNQGMSKRQAAIKAGYSPSLARNPKVLESFKTYQNVMVGMKDRLIAKGLTQDFIADKFVEWLDAQSKGEPDYETQMKAHKEWKEYMNDGDSSKPGRVKRKVTLEEFVLGEKGELD